MTLEQALKILEEATGAVSANREAHQKIIEALEVVKKASEPK